MNKADTILPDSISIFPHLLAFDIAMKNQLAKIPLQVLLVYLVDNVPAASLPLLASQFDVLGYKGLALCQTVQDQRNLIKRAIELHRFKGTPWAVKEALKSIGFTDIKLVEHSGVHWATFKVIITNDSIELTSESIADIMAMIHEYKNVRSKLESVEMTLQFQDVVDLDEDGADVYQEISASDDVTLTGALFYDGTGMHDGTYDHSGDSDTVVIT